ncbi:MAG: phage terminase large subunit [Clostridia bacterium]
MKKLILKGTPNPRQSEFFKSKARHTAYGGARGGGKSFAMRRKLCLLSLRYPMLNSLLLRRTLPELRENHMLPLRRELYGFADYNSTERVFTFRNGSRIKLGYCDTESDIYQYQGQEYDCIGIEEATHFTEEQRQFLTTCNRTTRNDFAPRMYYTCNPGNVGHDWVKRLFIEKRLTENEAKETYNFIPARIFDNKVLLNRDPSYLRALLALPDDLRRAHLYGDWDVFSGQYFREFSRDRHVIEPFDLDKRYKRFRSMDWGFRDPCCVLWHAVDDSSRVITYRELYVTGMRAEEVCSKVKEMSENEDIAYTVASPDMWQHRGTTIKLLGGFEGECIADVFNGGGVPLTPADNSRVPGWQRIRAYLSDGSEFEPRYQIFSTCENLIRYLPTMVYDKYNREDAFSVNDHAPEALRYALMSRPKPAHFLSSDIILPYDPLSFEINKTNGFLDT